MSGTGIPYCDETWDLTIGCRKRSEGCANCWATRIVHRLASNDVQGYSGDEYGRLYQTRDGGRDWEPTEYVNLLPWNLDKPRHWRKPRFIFVNSKSDLFDERVPFEHVGRAFDVMNETQQHRYMVLTKEPERMAEFIDWYTSEQNRPRRRYPVIGNPEWPRTFPHVILMVSVESAEHIDRLRTLAAIPACMRGVSFEPLLGPIGVGPGKPCYPDIHWVVIGCEKLLGGRAGRWAGTDPQAWWAAAAVLVQACRHAGVACWVKQGPGLDGRWVVTEPAEFPADCRIREKPKGLIL